MSVLKVDPDIFDRFQFKDGSKVTIYGKQKNKEILIYYRVDYETNILFNSLYDFLNLCEKQLDEDKDFEILIHCHYKKIIPDEDPVVVIGYDKNVVWLNDYSYRPIFSIPKKIFIDEYVLCNSEWW